MLLQAEFPFLAARLEQVVAIALLSAATVQAQSPGSWSSEFDRPGLVGRAFSLTSHGGDVYAGGDSFWSDGRYLGDLARFDGTHWREVPGRPNGDVIRALESIGSDLVVAGDFTVVGGQLERSIARWNGSSWQGFGTGIDGEVFDVALYQGELYAAGEFTQAGGSPVSGIARWNGTQWLSVGGNVTGTLGRTVWCLEVGPDGLLYAGGQFDAIGGVALAGLGVWDGTSWSPLIGTTQTPFGVVRDLAWHDGQLYAGGGLDFPTQSGENLVAWDGTDWNSTGGIPDWSISVSVYALQEFNGELYVGGNFIQAGPVSANAIARYDGATWTSIGGTGNSSFLSNAVLAMTPHAGNLYVGGEIDYVGTQLTAYTATVSESVARFDGAQWDHVGDGLGFDAEVRSAVAWNGGIAAVGRFTKAGTALSGQIAWFDGTHWRTIGVPNQNVSDCIVFEGDLVVTGDFTMIDGQPINSIARYDGTGWSSFGQGAGGLVLEVYQGDLYAGGSGGFRRWDGANWSAVINSGLSYVSALHVHDDGLMYVGGSASSVNPRVFSYDGTTLTPVGSGVNDTVDALISFQGDLIAGGSFSTAGGQPASRLARWDGASWSEFGGISGSLVKSLAIFQGELHAGGDLVAFSGDPGDWIARWDGAHWQPLGLGLNGTPFTLLPDETAGRLYVGGLFTQANWTGVFGESTPSYYFAAWEPLSEGGIPYCVAKSSSAGCLASMSATGTASATSPAPFDVIATEVANAKSGLVFYGSGDDNIPFQGGTLCVATPVRRTPIQSSGGSSPPISDCSGVLVIDFNAWIQSGVDPALVPGANVYAQAWYRDPQDPTGFQIGLSNGLRFTIGG